MWPSKVSVVSHILPSISRRPTNHPRKGCYEHAPAHRVGVYQCAQLQGSWPLGVPNCRIVLLFRIMISRPFRDCPGDNAIWIHGRRVTVTLLLSNEFDHCSSICGVLSKANEQENLGLAILKTHQHKCSNLVLLWYCTIV